MILAFFLPLSHPFSAFSHKGFIDLDKYLLTQKIYSVCFLIFRIMIIYLMLKNISI